MILSSNNWGGARVGAGRNPLSESEKKKGVKIYLTDDTKKDIIEHGMGNTFSEKAVEIINSELKKRKAKSENRK